MSEENKGMVRRIVEGINAGDEEAAVEALFAPVSPAARRVRRLFGEFRAAFPDWREEVVELVAERDTVAGRTIFSGPSVPPHADFAQHFRDFDRRALILRRQWREGAFGRFLLFSTSWAGYRSVITLITTATRTVL